MKRIFALVATILLIICVLRWCFGSTTPLSLQFFQELGNEINHRVTLDKFEKYLEGFTNRWGAFDNPLARWEYARSMVVQFGGGDAIWMKLFDVSNNAWWVHAISLVVSPFSTILTFFASGILFVWTYISDITAFSLVPAGLLTEYIIYAFRAVKHLLFA